MKISCNHNCKAFWVVIIWLAMGSFTAAAFKRDCEVRTIYDGCALPIMSMGIFWPAYLPYRLWEKALGYDKG